MSTLCSPAIPSGRWLFTEQLAAALHLKPQSLRAAICRTGHYFGLQPRKMLNGRLLWPADSLDRLQASVHQARQENGAKAEGGMSHGPIHPL